MAYATAEDVEAYTAMLNFDQLTINTVLVQDTGDTGVSGDTGVGGAGIQGDAVITAACVAQSSFMDGYLMGRYITPVITPSNVMGVLKTHCCRLVIYSLFQGRQLAEQYPSITTDRDITVKWLQDIAANKSSLPGQITPGIEALSGSMVGGSMPQVFGDGEILGNYGYGNYWNRYY
jgi:phage gp36-like protein